MKNWYFDKILKKGKLHLYHIILFETIEFMDGIDELKKVIRSSGEEMTRKVKQEFKLMDI